MLFSKSGVRIEETKLYFSYQLKDDNVLIT